MDSDSGRVANLPIEFCRSSTAEAIDKIDPESSGGVLRPGRHVIRPSEHLHVYRSSERASTPVKNDSPVKWMPGMDDNACRYIFGGRRRSVCEVEFLGLERWNFSICGARPLVCDDKQNAAFVSSVLECTGSPRKRHLTAHPSRFPSGPPTATREAFPMIHRLMSRHCAGDEDSGMRPEGR